MHLNIFLATTCAIFCSPIALHAEAVTFSPGCLAKIYVIGQFKMERKTLDGVSTAELNGLWPITTLPDAPAETLRLPAFPAIKATPLSKIIYENAEPNYLVTSKAGVLKNVNIYAVEFEGYFQSPVEGIYTFTVTADDPTELFIEGNKIAATEQTAKLSDGPRRNSRDDDWVSADATKNNLVDTSTDTVQASVKMAPGRWYAVTIVARQLWMSPYRNFSSSGGSSRDINRGAHLTINVSDPIGKSAPLQLSLPNVK
jgi:PA14 domain